MSRRDQEESAISLFSFQDIITSITGIMFLVVLLLVLIMISSHLPKSVSASPEETAELQKTLTVLRQQAAELQKNQDLLDEEIERLRKLSPAEAEQRLSQLRRTISELQQQINEIETQNNLAQQQNLRVETELKTLQQAVEQHQQQIRRRAEELSELQSAVKEQLKQLKLREKLIKYTVERPGSRSPILLELGKDGIQLFKLDDHSKYDFRTPEDVGASFIHLKDFISRHDPALYYFTVAVKPDGFRYAARLLSLLKQHNFQRGIEILPDNDSTLMEGDRS